MPISLVLATTTGSPRKLKLRFISLRRMPWLIMFWTGDV